MNIATYLKMNFTDQLLLIPAPYPQHLTLYKEALNKGVVRATLLSLIGLA